MLATSDDLRSVHCQNNCDVSFVQSLAHTGEETVCEFRLIAAATMARCDARPGQAAKVLCGRARQAVELAERG
jgi:hypothetical protein